MKFIGVGYLFTRRLRGRQPDRVPYGTGQSCAGPAGPGNTACGINFLRSELLLHPFLRQEIWLAMQEQIH